MGLFIVVCANEPDDSKCEAFGLLYVDDKQAYRDIEALEAYLSRCVFVFGRKKKINI